MNIGGSKGEYTTQFRRHPTLGGKDSLLCFNAYERWIHEKEQEGVRSKIRNELKGKTMACFCFKDCHGKTNARIANTTQAEEEIYWARWMRDENQRCNNAGILMNDWCDNTRGLRITTQNIRGTTG